MIIYGRNPVQEALRGRRAATVEDVWATEAAAREPWLQGVGSLRTASAREIENRCGSAAHQGVCARAGPYPYASAEELLAREGVIVALDQVQDPQNLGSICRTSECVGAAGLVIPERRAAEVTPAACKASAGAVEHLRVARVRNLADCLADARAAGFWCYGASARGDQGRTPVPYDAPAYDGGVVLVLGSEGRGLRPRVAAACDELVALPLRGRVRSLGVGAAAGALLYEILQRREAALDKAP